MIENRSANRPLRIVIVAGRGEVLRNFLFSETLSRLAREAEVTVLSVVDGEDFVRHFSGPVKEVIRLEDSPLPTLLGYFRMLIENAHDRWLWSAVAKNDWELRWYRARQRNQRIRRFLVRAVSWLFSFPLALRAMTVLEEELSYRFRPTRTFDELFNRLKPDLVFNGSQIHGKAAEMPMRVARKMRIPTAVFLFSWDNLTSQTRILVSYDYYFVWTKGIQQEFQRIYPEISPKRVIATGTPQFDFHTKPEFRLNRQDLSRSIGLDPERPFVLYTTGIDNHFFSEHIHVRQVATILARLDLPSRPQLVVRTYAKGTSAEMRALARENLPDVFFPPVLWDAEWETPRYEDAEIYTSLLLHCSLGINAASTVSLELMIFDKPIVNLRFDPPGSDLPWCLGFERHILFDHFRPLAQSGATMVAGSNAELEQMILRGLTHPEADGKHRRQFLAEFFEPFLDGKAGLRIAELLLQIASEGKNDSARVS